MVVRKIIRIGCKTPRFEWYVQHTELTGYCLQSCKTPKLNGMYNEPLYVDEVDGYKTPKFEWYIQSLKSSIVPIFML